MTKCLVAEWRDMKTAPTDGTIVNVMGRYKDATAGYPRYAGFYEGQWHEFTRNPPEPLVCWAWRPRDADWPSEPKDSDADRRDMLHDLYLS